MNTAPALASRALLHLPSTQGAANPSSSHPAAIPRPAGLVPTSPPAGHDAYTQAFTQHTHMSTHRPHANKLLCLERAPFLHPSMPSPALPVAYPRIPHSKTHHLRGPRAAGNNTFTHHWQSFPKSRANVSLTLNTPAPMGVPCTRCAHGDTLCFPVRRALSTMMAMGS